MITEMPVSVRTMAGMIEFDRMEANRMATQLGFILKNKRPGFTVATGFKLLIDRELELEAAERTADVTTRAVELLRGLNRVPGSFGEMRRILIQKGMCTSDAFDVNARLVLDVLRGMR